MTDPDQDAIGRVHLTRRGAVHATSDGRRLTSVRPWQDDPDPSRKVEINSSGIEGLGYSDCPGHPVWLEPDEWQAARSTVVPEPGDHRSRRAGGARPARCHPPDGGERLLPAPAASSTGGRRRGTAGRAELMDRPAALQRDRVDDSDTGPLEDGMTSARIGRRPGHSATAVIRIPSAGPTGRSATRRAVRWSRSAVTPLTGRPWSQRRRRPPGRRAPR
jgi:hypothetical protein